MNIIMEIETKDEETNEIVKKQIEISECFESSKEILDDIIKRFDNEIRTKVAGRYELTIFSPYLTCDEVSYSFSKNADDNIEINSSIKRDKISFID